MKTVKDSIIVDGEEYIRKGSLNNGAETVPVDIKERVKSYEDACAVLGLNPKELQVEVSGFGSDTRAIIAHSKLIVIARALNEGWTPNWSDGNEYKYYPWFKYDTAGFGFSCTYYGGWNAGTGVGSRLCFKTEALAEYAGKQFIEIYNEFLN
ncbi:MAG: hypothetical protein IT280_12915 [Ignavibacteria bacterium]|nr:hypothetical protein [Ignavibacteria bacterium]